MPGGRCVVLLGPRTTPTVLPSLPPISMYCGRSPTTAGAAGSHRFHPTWSVQEDHMTEDRPSWLPDGRVIVAQLASGVIDYYQSVSSAEPFRLPYPANLQTALDRLTLLAWHQGAPPPSGVIELL